MWQSTQCWRTFNVITTIPINNTNLNNPVNTGANGNGTASILATWTEDAKNHFQKAPRWALKV
jgi:hypothetical protein